MEYCCPFLVRIPFVVSQNFIDKFFLYVIIYNIRILRNKEIWKN